MKWDGAGAATSPIGAARGSVGRPVSRPGRLRLLSLTGRVLGARTFRTPTRDCGAAKRAGSWFRRVPCREMMDFSNAKALARKRSAAKKLPTARRSPIERSREFLVGRVRGFESHGSLSHTSPGGAQISLGQSAMDGPADDKAPAVSRIDYQDYQMDGLKRPRRVVPGGHMCLSNENSPRRVGTSPLRLTTGPAPRSMRQPTSRFQTRSGSLILSAGRWPERPDIRI